MSSLREVPTLLRCDDCAGELPRSAAFCPTCGAATARGRLAGASARASAPEAPSDLPGLTLIRPLGRGGTADVYLARQHDLHRLVAVKVIRADVAHGPAWRAFQREAQLVVRMSGHPHVLDVHTTGRTADGRPFLVMEHLDRGSLEDVIAAEGPLPPEEAARVGRAVADALGAAHALGIVHRDVKPANVLLGSDGTVKLADFGIARLVAARAPSTTGSVAFTPEYVAPEILIGGEVGPWTDVYELAATLVKAMTGASPHAALAEEGVHALLVRKLLHDPPPLGSAVPAGLRETLTAALAVEPAARPALAQLHQDLAGVAAASHAGRPGPRLAVPISSGRDRGATTAETSPTADRSATGFGEVTTATTIPLERLARRARPGTGTEANAAPPTGSASTGGRARGHRVLLVGVLVVLAAVVGTAVGFGALDRGDGLAARSPSGPSSTSLERTSDGATTTEAAEPAASTALTPPTSTTSTAPSTSTTAIVLEPTTMAPPAQAPPTTFLPAGSSPDPLAFLRDYYATLNRRAYEEAYAMLAPEFNATGSFEDYVGFWRTIDAVEVLAAQPAWTGDAWPRQVNLTIRYTTQGRSTAEVDELTVRPGEDGRLLISGFRALATA